MVLVEGEMAGVPKAAAGEYQWQIDAGMGVRTAQPAAKEHHRLIEERAALLVDVAELVKEVAENTHLRLLDPTELRNLSRLVAMVGEAVGFVANPWHLRNDMEGGNVKRDAAGRISLNGQPQKIAHQSRLLQHLILVVDVRRLRIVHHRLRTLLPLA